jgi:hypothetical protein
MMTRILPGYTVSGLGMDPIFEEPVTLGWVMGLLFITHLYPDPTVQIILLF